MIQPIRTFLAFCFVLATQFLSAQSILSINTTSPDGLFVCGTDTISVTLQNTGNATLSLINLGINLPSGVEYQPGTVMGATQMNITNLTTPKFEIAALPAGSSQTVQLLISARCNLVEAINNGQLFFHTITASVGNINEQIVSPQYRIETGLLIITSVNPTVATGSIPQIIQRTITVRNTRLGRIGLLRLEDDYNSKAIDISLNGGTDLNPADTVYTTNITGAAFSNIGNGDQWLDQDEEYAITEQIEIKGCRDSTFEVRSRIRVYWGCDAEICTFDSTIAFVRVEPSILNPTIEVVAEMEPFEEQCGGAPTTQSFTIQNTGTAPATNVFITVWGVPGTIAIDHTAIEVNNNGTWAAIPSNLNKIDTLFDCSTQALSTQILISLGTIQPQQTVLVRFGAYACSSDSCGNLMDSMRIEYAYRKYCPSDALVADRAWFHVDSSRYKFDFQSYFQLGSCLTEGQIEQLDFELKSSRLTTFNGFLKIHIDLPLGITLDTFNCRPFIKNTTIKASSVIIAPSANGKTSVDLLFPTPIAFDSIRIGYCVRYNCLPGMVCENLNTFPSTGGEIPVFTDASGNPDICEFPCALKLRAKAILTTNSNADPLCSFGGCDEYYLIVNDPCNNPSTGPSGSCWPVGMAGTYEVYRTNYDCEDQDNDRIADSDLDASGPGVAIRRFIPGDTLRLDMRGSVVTQFGSIDDIVFKVFHENLSSDFLVADGDSFDIGISGPDFCSRDHITYAGGTLIIKKVDGTLFTCPLGYSNITDEHLATVQLANVEPQVITEVLSTMDYNIRGSFTHCAGAPIVYGDSAILLMDWKIKENIIPNINDTMTGLRLMNFRTIPDDARKQYTYLKPNPPFLCQYSGFTEQLLTSVNTLRPCENSLAVSPMDYFIQLARNNLFPYEVRPLSRFLNLYHNIPQGVDLLSLKLRGLTLTDGQVILPASDMPHTINGNQIVLDMNFLNPIKLDEGYKFTIDYLLGPSCRFTDAEAQIGEAEVWTKDCFYDEQIRTFPIGEAFGFYSAAPRIEVLTNDTLTEIVGRAFTLQGNLKNLTPQTARNVWMKLEAVNGSYTSAQLIVNGAPIGQIGDIYQLNTLSPSANLPFQLVLDKSSCEPLDLRIIYGWNCEQVTNLNSDLCNRDTLQVRIVSLNPEMELDIVQQPIQVPMCDTTGWFTVRIFNANIGNAYDVLYTVRLPQGLMLEPGTVQIAFPEGAPFQNFPDPQSLGPNLYQWNVSNLLSAIANGLLGVNNQPQNGFTIRFRARTNCGFVANTQPIFGVSARKACGTIANTLRKPSTSVMLEGTSEPSPVQIAITPTNQAALNCGDETTLQIQLNLGGAPGIGDSIYLVIPNGFSYVAGSYAPGQNAPAGPPTTSGQNWQLALPLNLSQGSILRFTVKLRYEAPAGCADVTLAIQTRQTISVFCPAINSNCAAYLASGEALYNIPVINSDIAISGVQLQYIGGVYTLEGLVKNESVFPSGNTPLSVYLDANVNGRPDQGETLLTTIPNVSGIPALSSRAFSVTLTGLSPNDLCKLLLYMDENEACLCAPISLPLQNLSIQSDALVSCQVQPVSFGLSASASGHTYSWAPAGGLSCTNCPNTTFTPGSSVQPGTALTFVLTDQSAGCTVQYAYSVTFEGAADLLANDAIICRGESVTLTVTPSIGSFQWSGPGISNTTSAGQVLTPAITSTWTVTVTTVSGCTATDAVTVIVLESDSIVLAPALICAGESLIWEGDTIKQSGYFCKKYQSNNGCDSLICREVIVLPSATNELIKLCEGDQITVFDSIVGNAGTYCRTFQNILGCDSTHCVTVEQAPAIPAIQQTIYTVEAGQNVTLEGPPGFATYAWSPPEGLSCNDCQNPVTTADTTKAYVVTVTNSDGCTTVAEHRILLLPACTPDRIQIPNAFTPNGDQSNDVFRVPEFEGVELILEILVFNRWGQLIYEGTGPQAGWDGKVNGKDAPMDTYVYIISVGCPTKEGAQRHGEITLIR